MLGVNPSVYVRAEFNVASASQFDALTLGMKYDDGFVAYLNGVKVAENNAPATTAWDSSATASRNDNAAVVYQDFDLTPYLHLLQNGANVLAIQGLNISAADADFLLSPQLRAHIADIETFAGGLVINEVDGAADSEFRIEIMNRGTTPIELGGLILATTSGGRPPKSSCLRKRLRRANTPPSASLSSVSVQALTRSCFYTPPAAAPCSMQFPCETRPVVARPMEPVRGATRRPIRSLPAQTARTLLRSATRS